MVVIAATTATVHAQTSAGNDSLKSARAAWANADFDLAPGLYEKALDRGGLARPDVVEAYVRIGAALAIAGQKKAAGKAFRSAALLDPSFQLPPEAGTLAASLADAAKTAQAQVGSLSVKVQAPGQVDAGSAIGVDVTVSPSRGTPVTTIALLTRDALASRADEQSASVAASNGQAYFDVPAKMTLPDASLVLRVRAKDAHDNELGTAEQRVHVASATAVTPAAVATLDDHHQQRGGFWSSPWPYVIGGAALAAAGGVTAWVLTRPTDNADVGQVRVQLVH